MNESLNQIESVVKQHRTAVKRVQAHVEIITQVESRLEFLSWEIQRIDSEAVEQAAEAFKQGKNIDWKAFSIDRLTLERELAAIPLILKRLKEQATTLRAETRRLAEAVTDAESKEREATISGKIKELLAEELAPDSARSTLGLDRAEFNRLKST